MKFAAVGASGIVVNQAAIWAAADGVGIYYVWAAVVATQVSSTWNFALTERFVFSSDKQGRLKRLFWFTVMNNGWMVARLPLLWALTDLAGLHYLWSNLIAICAATLFRFFVADRYIWASPAPVDQAVAEALERRHLYDVHGILAISSDERLPELEVFRVAELPRPPDLDVTIGHLRGLRSRIEIEGWGDGISYREWLKGLGFATRISLGPNTKVRVSRLIGRSPHVLYTNVVEPVIRWMLVRKGYALIHGACLIVNGKGVLITARTDTGKTTTCLKTVREHGSEFLSDDMVIVGRDGVALCYPKPLTISSHTLHAVGAAPLRWDRKLWLQFQSRIHSKAGRRFGMLLAELKFPVASLNAVTQIVVPPPKFFIEELLPDAVVQNQIEIDQMFVIEPGASLVEPLDHREACRTLLANTEDAYGFPPYPFLAPILCGEDALVEAQIQAALLERIPTTRLRTPDRNWYKLLPELVSNGHNGNGAVAIDLRDATPALDEVAAGR